MAKYKKKKKEKKAGTEIAYRKDMEGLVVCNDLDDLLGVPTYWIQIPFPSDGLMAKEYMANWLKDIPENLFWREDIIRKTKLETNPKWGFQNLSRDEAQIIEYAHRMRFLLDQLFRGRVWWEGESILDKFTYVKKDVIHDKSQDTKQSSLGF